MNPSPVSPGFRITGRHVLVAMVLFFGIVIAVDGAFLVAAYRTFPGEVSVTPYEDGLAHNRTVAQHRAQAALGWRATAAATGAGVEVTLSDRRGEPVRGLSPTGRLRRPATDAGEITLRFAETAPGLYVAPAAPSAGAWDLLVTAKGPGNAPFEAERRLTWP